MSSIEFSEISNELIRSEVHEAIKTLTKSADDQIKITSVSKINSDNPSCNIYRISFTTNAEANAPTSSSLILKMAPENLTRRFLSYTRPCLLREIFSYDEVRKVKIEIQLKNRF